MALYSMEMAYNTDKHFNYGPLFNRDGVQHLSLLFQFYVVSTITDSLNDTNFSTHFIGKASSISDLTQISRELGQSS